MIIIHVQHLAKQQTPFSKVKSPESPKHREDKVGAKGRVRERREEEGEK